MTDPVFGLIYIFIFPVFSSCLPMPFSLSWTGKIAARMQQRVGPPFFQPFADFIKMLGRRSLIPPWWTRQYSSAAPLVALAAVMTAYLYVPIIGKSPLAFQGDLVVVLYLLSLPTIASSSWAGSPGTSSLPSGGSWEVTRLYLLSPVFLALTPALMAGTWSISEIVLWQQKNMWFIFLQPIGFIVALIGLQAKLERTPFDIPEAETSSLPGHGSVRPGAGSPSWT